MRDGIDCDDDLLELADETSRIAALIDDPAIRPWPHRQAADADAVQGLDRGTPGAIAGSHHPVRVMRRAGQDADVVAEADQASGRLMEAGLGSAQLGGVVVGEQEHSERRRHAVKRRFRLHSLADRRPSPPRAR